MVEWWARGGNQGQPAGPTLAPWPIVDRPFASAPVSRDVWITSAAATVIVADTQEDLDDRCSLTRAARELKTVPTDAEVAAQPNCILEMT